jgi:hypothetical protein
MGGANGNKATSYKTDKPGAIEIVPGYSQNLFPFLMAVLS